MPTGPGRRFKSTSGERCASSTCSFGAPAWSLSEHRRFVSADQGDRLSRGQGQIGDGLLVLQTHDAQQPATLWSEH